MGLVAFGIGCGQEGIPGVYSSIPKTVDWIKRVALEEVSAERFLKYI